MFHSLPTKFCLSVSKALQPPPPPKKKSLVQVLLPAILKLKVTSYSSRGVFGPPVRSHAAPLRAVSLITYQHEGETLGKEMSSWRQTTKHIVCPAAAHLSIHIPPAPPQGCHKTHLCISMFSCCPQNKSTNCIFLCVPLLLSFHLFCKLYTFPPIYQLFHFNSFVPFVFSFICFLTPISACNQ